MKRVFLILMTILVAVPLINGAENISDRKTPSLNKALATSDIWIDVNRMDAVFRNNGTWMYDNVSGGEGLFWPKGTHNSPIFAGGQWIGAMVDGEVRVAGIQHSASEYQAGEITSPDVATNRMDGKYKWYALYPGGVGDWSNWPVDQGAPVDENGDPQLIGDVTAFSVWNDLADHAEYSTNKLNAEVRQTVFAFNRADALGDMIFIKWQIINKSGGDWGSTYFSIWLDPDLGGATDDLVGCDTTLGLGFVYNATNDDQTYGTAPPAAGIDFFQGPIIDEIGSTVALPDGTVLQDKTMLKMTSFVFYDNNDTPSGNPNTGGDVWNYFRGIWRDDVPITYGMRGSEDISAAHPITRYMFPGDPETETGTGTTLSEPWLDYDEDDRRFLMTTGPFDMGPWVDENSSGLPDFGEPGVQEIVAVVIVARGDDNLNSVTVLKEVDKLAQLAYDLNFNLATAPTPPAVTVSELPNQVVLTWDEKSEFDATGIAAYSSTDPIVAQAFGDTVVMDNVEKVIDDSTYNFYGYTVYQYADAGGRNPVVLEHWDNGGVAAAEPYTFQRFARILVNKHTGVGEVGAPLINGKEYYFGVVPEASLEYGAPVILEGATTILTAVAQYQPGIAYDSEYNDTLTVIHTVTDATKDLSDGSTVTWVVDPSQTSGLTYTVSFNEDATWNLTTPGDTIAKNVTNQEGDAAYNVYDGLMIKVQGPPPGINPNKIGIAYGEGSANSMTYLTGWDWSNGDRWIGGRAKGWIGLFGGLGNGADWWGTTLTSGADYYDVELLFAGCETCVEGESAAEMMAKSKAENPDRWSKALAIDGWGTWGTVLGDIPISAWDTESDPPRQLSIAFVEDSPGNFIWDMGWDGTAFVADGGYEYILILADDYDATYTDLLALGADPALPILYTISPQARGSRPYLQNEFDMQIFASNINATWDIFSFTAPDSAAVTDTLLAVDIKKINVVPNPYYGYHSGELDIFNRWVQFTYLPPTATIRIFDLAGQLIRKLEKDDPATTFLQWDLSNAYELPVASGVYIYVVDTEYGQKVGKMAVFTPNERLDTW